MAYIFCNIRSPPPPLPNVDPQCRCTTLPLPNVHVSRRFYPPSPQCLIPPMSRFVFWLWGAQLKKWVSFFFIEGHPSMTILTLGRWKFRLWGGGCLSTFMVALWLWGWPFDFGISTGTLFKKQKYMCFEFVSFLLHTPIPFWRVALTRLRCTLCDDWRSDKVPRTPKKIGHHPAFCYIIYWRVPMLLGGAWPLCYLCYRKKRQS